MQRDWNLYLSFLSTSVMTLRSQSRRAVHGSACFLSASPHFPRSISSQGDRRERGRLHDFPQLHEVCGGVPFSHRGRGLYQIFSPVPIHLTPWRFILPLRYQVCIQILISTRVQARWKIDLHPRISSSNQGTVDMFLSLAVVHISWCLMEVYVIYMVMWKQLIIRGHLLLEVPFKIHFYSQVVFKTEGEQS